jgi:poly-gamma-glutamate synthesis protein (capsule biosynthesis protein)
VELAEALKAAGVDMVQLANSAALNNGLLGLTQTTENFRQLGLEPVGAFGSDEEFQRQKGFTLRSICGVKVAFVSFTKGMDDLGLPVGSENRVNLLYTDYTSTYQEVDTKGIKSILEAVALEKPDITVALVHWGSEYNQQISDSQRQIAKLMQDNGVDAIVGTHSHYVQQVEYNENAGTVVAWSLGDFLGDGDRAGTEYSLVLELEITRNNQTGKAKITDMDYTPIYTVKSDVEGDTTMKILRIPQAIAAYEADSIDKVSQEVYNAMKSALSKVEAKIVEE